jgi:hypothetical protein
MHRTAAVAGQFYAGEKKALREQVRNLLHQKLEPQKAVGIMVPHAGYIYSGAIAGQTFSLVQVPDRVVLLGPNHTGYGAAQAVYPAGSWQTPLGDILIDSSLAGQIIAGCGEATADELAHRYEHSLEVQVPFIQMKAPQARLVPVCLGHAPLQQLLDFGRSLGRLLATQPEPALLVASSDMTHFESAASARQRDMKALEKILAVDAEGLYRLVAAEAISMCGVVPTVVMLAAARELGACKGTLVRYGNSGETSGDHAEVVGYAGVIIA